MSRRTVQIWMLEATECPGDKQTTPACVIWALAQVPFWRSRPYSDVTLGYMLQTAMANMRLPSEGAVIMMRTCSNFIAEHTAILDHVARPHRAATFSLSLSVLRPHASSCASASVALHHVLCPWPSHGHVLLTHDDPDMVEATEAVEDANCRPKHDEQAQVKDHTDWQTLVLSNQMQMLWSFCGRFGLRACVIQNEHAWKVRDL